VLGLLEHGTVHAALIAEILSLLAGRTPAPLAAPEPPLEPVTNSELRVLRYLPTNLTAPEIASELYVSRNTVKAHIAVCTPSSAPTAGPRPWRARVPSACWHPPRSRATPSWSADPTVDSGGRRSARPAGQRRLASMDAARAAPSVATGR
jgi:DNA-binding CsgD family transcriptional regulator